jgi:hypothetical protein
MSTEIQMRVASLKVSVKSLDTANGLVSYISFGGSIVLLILGLSSGFNLLFIGGAIALAAQAWLVVTLISAFVSKLNLDIELASTEL